MEFIGKHTGKSEILLNIRVNNHHTMSNYPGGNYFSSQEKCEIFKNLGE